MICTKIDVDLVLDFLLECITKQEIQIGVSMRFKWTSLIINDTDLSIGFCVSVNIGYS